MVVLGDKTEGDNVELENVKTGEKETLSIEELINKIDYLANIENQYNKKGWLISDRGYEQFFGKYGRLRECVLVGLMAAIIFIVVSRGAEIRYSFFDARR